MIPYFEELHNREVQQVEMEKRAERILQKVESLEKTADEGLKNVLIGAGVGALGTTGLLAYVNRKTRTKHKAKNYLKAAIPGALIGATVGAIEHDKKWAASMMDPDTPMSKETAKRLAAAAEALRGSKF